MKIIKARTSGFCFGVKKAVDTAYAIANPKQSPTMTEDQEIPDKANPATYMLGELIHNRQVTEELIDRGLCMITAPSELPAGSQVLIRAHGISPQVRAELADRNAQIIDCTCPYVNTIHQLVRDAYAAGSGVIITGSPSHPEVVGINGECDNSAMIIEQAVDAENVNFDQKPYVLVSQTTYSMAEFDKIKCALQKKIANLQIFDTICITTENRQKEARSIAGAVDVMLVIGSSNSSNTRKLMEVCISECGETYLVEEPEDIRRIFDGRKMENLSIGLIAGASTPERMIGEVILAMSENEAMQNQPEQNDFSFSDFIDSIPQLKRGATVKGVVIRYDNETVYVDVRDKSEGRIPRHEFDGDPDYDLDDAIANHTEIDVYVRNIRNSDMGKEITLSKARVDFGKYKGLIEDAFAEKTPIQVKVVNIVKDGVIATYGGVDIYIHRTQLEMGTVADLEEYKGKTLEILVTQYDPDKKRLRVSGSRRALLNNMRKEKAEEVWSSIEPGKVFSGTVRSLTDFGAFVDIGGVDGLVHVSELSWKRIRHPSEVVSVGNQIDVFVKDFDPEKKRISLGYKKPADDPYHDVESRFPVGSIVHGVVVRMFPFGAFVEIAPGVDALCHISQISNVRLSKPSDVLTEGLEVDARVLEVSNEARRVSISIKEVEPIDPIRKDEEPAVKDEEPAVKDEEPAVKDEEPAVKDEEPAVKDEEPVVKDEEPAVKDEEPAVKDEEPAVNPEG